MHRFERQLEEVASTDAVGPEQMGRTAAKMESLDSMLETLHAEARRLLPEAYRKCSGESKCLKIGVSEACGRVVGALKSANPVVAKEADASRLSVPKDLLSP